MAKKYLTPDFDVTVYEIEDEITLEILASGQGPNDDIGSDDDWNGDTGFED